MYFLIRHLSMQKHKLHLQMLDDKIVNNYGMFQTYLHLCETSDAAFLEPNELLVPVYTR